MHRYTLQDMGMQIPNANTEVPVIKDSETEGPIPTAWRPILASIVAAFARHDYRLANGISGVAPVSEETAVHIRKYIESYGATLVTLPQDSWNTSVCIWMGDHWDALVDLWTKQEGASDLVLQVQVSEMGSEYVVTVYMVYVP